nr:radical SAM protein [Candidatus Delongbacteria bacterium]
ALNLHTPNGLHVRYLTPEIARLMKQSRFKTIRLSLESALPDLQEQMDRKISNSGYQQGVEALLSAGYRHQDFETYLMIGMPGQSLEQVMQSILFLAERNLKISLASFSPIPHSPMFRIHPPAGTDPLLHNPTIYHYQTEEIRPIFKKIRNLVSIINRSVELECNIFHDRLLKNLIRDIYRHDGDQRIEIPDHSSDSNNV